MIKRKKIFSLTWLVLIIMLCLGCQDTKKIEEVQDMTKGVVESYSFEEVKEKTNYVKIVTNKNKIILIELYPDKAPLTVKNFQELVSEKFYDNLIFHRVIADFMIQTGDPSGTGYNGSGKTIKGEFSENGVKNDLKHEKGIVSMARAEDMDSASSQFFICVSNNVSYLDNKYAAFGRVIAGQDVADEISKVPTDENDKPTSIQKMRSIRFVTVKKTNEKEG